MAFNGAGGLHHAMPGRDSGFCIFNDPVVAINLILSTHERVAYVDIDAHHTPGVFGRPAKGTVSRTTRHSVLQRVRDGGAVDNPGYLAGLCTK